MALRLVLVSAVAGLGLSFPTRNQLESWTQSAQGWAVARLAAWDAQMPAGVDAFQSNDDSAPLFPQMVAPSLATSTTPLAAATAHGDWPSATERACQTGLDLATSLMIPADPTAFDVPILPPTPTPTVAAKPAAPAAVTVVKPAAAPNAAFDAAMNAVVASFAADAPAPKAPAIVTSKPLEAPAIARAEPKKAPAFEPVPVPDDLYPGIAFALNRQAEGLNPEPSAPAPAAITKTSPHLHPILVGGTFYPSLNDALNHQALRPKFSRVSAPAPPAKPLGLARPVPSAPEVVGPGDRLNHAMRLTREAVFAWANLLNSPAVVTISH